SGAASNMWMSVSSAVAGAIPPTIAFPTGNTASLFCTTLDTPVTVSNIEYYVKINTDTGNNYDIGIYSGVPGIGSTQVAKTRPKSGSTFAGPTANAFRSQSLSPPSVTIQRGSACMAITSSCTSSCNTIGGADNSFEWAENTTFGISTGGTLPSSIT